MANDRDDATTQKKKKSVAAAAGKQEPTPRIPSPGSASVSSVNSIRPLEWDSGADIGYQRANIAQSSDLSTVERIALANRTMVTSASLMHPLAQSTPCVQVSTIRTAITGKPLVDYSLTSICETLNLDLPKTAKKLYRGECNVSRSLEDVRLGSQHHQQQQQQTSERKCKFAKSRSSQNMRVSSSSIATLVPQSRRCSDKSVQVNENSFGRYSTYTVFRRSVSAGNAASDEFSDSVDGASFEYVPGSVYGNMRHRKSEVSSSTNTSEVNTVCTEVLDGVDLLTRYVNNLNIRNKEKVMKKVAESLMKCVNAAEKVSSGSVEERAATPPVPSVAQINAANISSSGNVCVGNAGLRCVLRWILMIILACLHRGYKQ